MKGVPFFNKWYIKGVPFLPRWRRKGKGLDPGVEPPVLNFVKYPFPRPRILGSNGQLQTAEKAVFAYRMRFSGTLRNMEWRKPVSQATIDNYFLL